MMRPRPFTTLMGMMLALALALALAFPLLAAEPEPATEGANWAGVVLARETGPITGNPGVVHEVRKIKADDGIRVTVLNPGGATLWTSDPPLGEQDRKFMLGEETRSLALHDLDQDGTPEILVSAFIGPRASGLFAFRYDPTAKTFVAIPSRFPNEDLERECLISDVPQELGGDLILRKDGTAQVIGLIYAEDAAEPPAPALWTFTFKDGAFVHTKTEKLPPPPTPEP